MLELAFVVAIIGVFAGFAVPRFMNDLERGNAAVAAGYLSTVRFQQERYRAVQGVYADDIKKLEATLSGLENFSVGPVCVPGSEMNLETGWQLALTRERMLWRYGAYKIVFNHNGFDRRNSTVPDEVSPFETSNERERRFATSSLLGRPSPRPAR